MRGAVSRRGVTLVECAVALVVAGLVLASLHALLTAAARLRRADAARLEARRAARAAATALRAELEPVSSAGGDILALLDTAITLRATRGAGFTCGIAAGRPVLDSASFAAFRGPDPARDGALVFADGDRDDTADDGWEASTITATGPAPCADGRPGLALSLSPATPASLPQGTPVRTYEVVEYRLYRDGAGLRWLGVRNHTGGRWSATSPIAGPLRPGDGLLVEALDSAGFRTGPAAAVAIRVTVRARTSGAPSAEDSARALVPVRGP